VPRTVLMAPYREKVKFVAKKSTCLGLFWANHPSYRNLFCAVSSVASVNMCVDNLSLDR